ncbi:MAG: MFS transporter [Phycisphaerae bacterium]|nr:MFS transporter [Phycisphaerae bacterium]
MSPPKGNPDRASAAASRLGGLAMMTRALRHRNYRLFFFGQGVSVIGTWMQNLAMGWLVYRLTGSKLLLGVAAFCSQIPVFCLAPLAGVIADRIDRRRLVIATQTLALIQAAALGVLTLTGTVQVWHILALGLALGMSNAFDIPTRQSFIVQMLDSPQDLPNALALNSLLVNSARIIGPAIAGRVISGWGEGQCFLINSASYLAVIVAMLAMRVRPVARRAVHPSLLTSLKEGARYVAGFAPIRSILLLLAAISLLGMPYSVQLPAFARDVLHGDAQTQGMLLGAVGVGAVAAVLYMASRSTVRGLGRIMAASCALFGAALIAFGLSHWQPLSMALLTVAGFGAVVQMIGANTLVQTLVDDDKRGRVMSFHAICFMGMGPFGNLLIGSLAQALGAPTAVILGGAGCVLAAVAFATALPHLGRAVHPIYVKMGIAAEPMPNGTLRGDLSQEVRF